MFGRIALLVVVTLLIFAVHYRRYRDKKKVAISIALLVYTLAIGYSGYILMRIVPPLLLLHILAVVSLYFSIFYYLFKDKLNLYVVVSPLFTILIYIGLSYFNGAR